VAQLSPHPGAHRRSTGMVTHSTIGIRKITNLITFSYRLYSCHNYPDLHCRHACMTTRIGARSSFHSGQGPPARFKLAAEGLPHRHDALRHPSPSISRLFTRAALAASSNTFALQPGSPCRVFVLRRRDGVFMSRSIRRTSWYGVSPSPKEQPDPGLAFRLEMDAEDPGAIGAQILGGLKPRP